MTEQRPMPEVAPPVWENIPDELARRQQWVLWKFEPPIPTKRNPTPKWRKMPYYVQGGKRTDKQGSDRDRARLSVLSVVRTRFEKGGYHGVGFAFLPDDGLIGIDIDEAIDPQTGEVSATCIGMVKAFSSFTEYSPSGTGGHIIGFGQTESNKCNVAGLEMFCGSQFFTVTGRLWPGAPTALAALPERAIERLHTRINESKAAARAASGVNHEPAQPAQPGRSDETPAELEGRVRLALDALSPDLSYEDWISIGWALRDAFGEPGFDMWNGWSERGGSYPGAEKLRSHWRSFKASNKSADQAVGVIFARARDAGWKPPGRPRKPKPPRANVPATAKAGSTPPATGGGGAGDDGPPVHHDRPPDDDGDEMPVIRMILGKGGKNEDCRENILYCLRADPTLRHLVAHNAFTELQDKTRKPPWGGEPGEWTEEDDLMLGEYLARTHQLLIKGTGTLRAGVQMAARENRYHPIIEALRKIKWDGVSRLDEWMIDCFGVVDRPYARMISRFFILGMVARLLRPGCKFDYMLILQGAQGEGKSTAFRELAAPFFMDTPFRIGDKDAYLSLQGVWLVEFSELEAMSKSESTAIKAFVTSVEDRFRPPYGSRMVKMPRRAVLAGTTNSDQFLKDATGDRRFWPIHVTDVRHDLLRAMRDQLFAEALHLFDTAAGTEAARYFPTKAEEKELFHPEQDRWRMVDVWTDILGDYVNRSHPGKGEDIDAVVPARRGFFTSQELFAKALDIKAERMDNAKLMQGRVSNAMRELGFAAAREPTGARKRGFLRPGWEWGDKGVPRPIPVLLPAQPADGTDPPEEDDDVPI